MVIESAVQAAPEITGAIQPVLDTIQPLLIKLSLIVGGIFGVYVILIFLRVHYERKHLKVLNNILFDLDQLNMHYGLPHSKSRKGWFKRLWGWLKGEKIEPSQAKKKT